MILDTIHKEHLVIDGFDMNDIAGSTNGSSSDFDRPRDSGQVPSCEVEHSKVGVGLDHDGKLDLAFELLDVGRILGLATGIVIRSRIRNRELVLLKDGLALGSFTKIIVTDEDSTSIIRDSVMEALILRLVSKVRFTVEDEGTCQLHLVLHLEQLMVWVDTGVGTVRQLSNELIARHEGRVFLRHLIDESTLDVGRGRRQDGGGGRGLILDSLDRTLAHGDSSHLATMSLAVNVRRVLGRVCAAEGA